MLNELFFMFITSTYISSICSIFDIVWIFKLIKRWKFRRDLKNNTTNLVQYEANDLLEGHPVDMVIMINFNKKIKKNNL